MPEESRPTRPGLKLITARTLKWNTIDRVASQVLYAVVGIVLANVLSQEDFGLVGVIIVFQAFAILFVDSGFGAALLQKKNCDEADYSTVFWFNLGVSVAVYWILFFCAPLIADIFQGDRRLIPLSRVMFLSFILNGLGIVQTNRLMKKMDVKQVTIANVVGLTVSGGLAMGLALGGFGAWALVWQTVALGAVKTGWLWITGGWYPRLRFSRESLRSIWRIGMSVFSSSLLNTICLNIYNFVIGAFYNLRALGVYTQADKWSKMGSASISQVLTATFVPLLARFQDNRADFHRYMGRINRFAAFITFPALGALIILAEPIFHLLFGHKWDASIPLFQILCVRGIFVVLISLINNYILALGKARLLMTVEIVKDALTAAAIFSTIWFGSVELLVWGQMGASALTFAFVIALGCRATGYSLSRFLLDLMPYCALSMAAMAAASGLFFLLHAPALRILAGLSLGAVIYWGVLKIAGSVTLADAEEYLLGRFRRRT